MGIVCVEKENDDVENGPVLEKENVCVSESAVEENVVFLPCIVQEWVHVLAWS
jgi:hypothetical protein